MQAHRQVPKYRLRCLESSLKELGFNLCGLELDCRGTKPDLDEFRSGANNLSVGNEYNKYGRPESRHGHRGPELDLVGPSTCTGVLSPSLRDLDLVSMD